MSTKLQEQNIQQSCDRILNNVRCSNLNFSLNETPFSIYITIRKSLTKVHHVANPQVLFDASQAALGYNLTRTTVVENDALKKEVKELKKNLEDSEDVVKCFETKIGAAEAQLYKHFKEVQQWKDTVIKKDDEIESLKSVIKRNNSEKSKTTLDLNSLKKSLKIKEK